MNFFAFLIGSGFCELYQHGKETEQLIAQKDDQLLQHSTIELERYFDKPPQQLQCQNAFSLAWTLLLFLLTFALNLLTLLHILPALSPPARAAAFFLPSIVFIISILSASYLISRGFNRGLAIYSLVYNGLFIATILQLVNAVLTSDTGHVLLMLVALTFILSCRSLINGVSFIVFILYCRTQRVANLARSLR